MEYYKNLRTDKMIGLKAVNKEWADCVAKDFLT